MRPKIVLLGIKDSQVVIFLIISATFSKFLFKFICADQTFDSIFAFFIKNAYEQ